MNQESKTTNKGRLYWEDIYSEKNKIPCLPWHLEPLDNDLKDFFNNNFKISAKNILDIGCGSGTQTIQLEKFASKVIGIDIAENAINYAKELALKKRSKVQFLQHDILTAPLPEKFSHIIDRGCFHILPPNKRDIYINNIKKMLTKDGIFLLKCFSIKEKKKDGPYRFSLNNIRELFGKSFNIVSYKESFFIGSIEENKKEALFVILKLK